MNDSDLRIVDDYELLDPLGRGGQSQIFRARHRRMNRLVALKFLDRRFAHDAAARRLFRVEMQVSGLLIHPKIMRAYDAGECDGVPYLVMELRQGTDLARLRQERAITPSEAVCYVRDAAEGLAFAHAQGVVHRDVKPSNLFRIDGGSVLVFDWGLAKCSGVEIDDDRDVKPPKRATPAVTGVLPDERSPTLDDPTLMTHLGPQWNEVLRVSHDPANTMMLPIEPVENRGSDEHASNPTTWAGHIVGTPAFMAPEMIGGSDVDHRADIFGLGATLFSLLTGRSMYSGDFSEILQQKLAGRIPSLSSEVDGVSKQLDSIYHRMVARQPSDRFQSMDEVVQALSGADGRAKIFISYRRQDSIDATDRIYEKLSARFGAGGIFMDVDTIPAGLDYRTYLQDAVSHTAVMLVVIGEHWVNAAVGSSWLFRGRKRLFDPLDWVRIEIEMAIERKIPIIPVLVGRAQLPEIRQLPPSLQPLCAFQTAEVRPGREHANHVAKLIQAIEAYY